MFSLALIREQRGEPERCPDCGSYQVAINYRNEDEEAGVEAFLLCEACGWESQEPVEAA